MTTVKTTACALALLAGLMLPSSPLSLGATASAAGGPRQANQAVGIHVSPDAPDTPPVGVFGVERLWDTGALWCRMNPEPGLWDFGPLNSQLDAAASRGAHHAIVVLGFPPAHAVSGEPNPGEAPWMCPSSGYSSALPTDEVWQDYLQRTVDAVAAWRTANPLVQVHFQVWNEPAVRWFLRRGETPERLVELAAQARLIVRGKLSGSVMLSPPIVANSTADRAQWQQSFVAASGAWSDARSESLFDVWTANVYPQGATFDELWSGPLGYVSRVTDVMTTIGPGIRTGNQVWITEINANISLLSPPTQVLSDADQAAFVRAVTRDARQRGIGVVVWYRWHYDPWRQGSGQVVFNGSSSALAVVE